MLKERTLLFCFALLFINSLKASAFVFNDPHKPASLQKSRYLSFSTVPKTLDPARAYSANEMVFIEQIYEPPIQYSYLKRPYSLTTLTAESMPKIRYFDKNDNEVKDPVENWKSIAYTLYDIKIKKGILYQDHPAFAKGKNGNFLYHNLNLEDLEDLESIGDFEQAETRELTAHDYVYQIKRLAHPDVTSPIYGIMIAYIEGLEGLAEELKIASKENETKKENFLDLRDFKLSGAKVINSHHYQIKVKGLYTQFIYWLAMPFFAPIPWEADRFYSGEDMDENNLTLDWYPIGTGPYFLKENNPNKEIILSRNKNFHDEFYPSEGEEGDKEKGYLSEAGKKIPFIDEFIFSLEKEVIPKWNKFLQGYYDKSSIAADSFDQAIKIDKDGTPILTKSMEEKKIQLQTTVATSVYYIGFNMLDPLVGGKSERAKKLRQAISIAYDYEEYISIFLNGRGISAQSPVPPGIFGYKEGLKGFNPLVFYWDKKTQKPKRHPLQKAKDLMAEAGYKNGIDPKTGQLLIINYEATSSGSPGDKSRLNWTRKQFAKIGIQLNVRSTQYNRFREKVRTGNAQIFSWGWLADYPDPENFLFLLYGPNGKVKFGGENAANYQNDKFDKLFNLMKNLPNGERRQEVIDEMLLILREDSPWLWGYHPIDFTLSHSWNKKSKAHSMTRNVYKYEKINEEKRKLLRAKWNRADFFPIFVILFFFLSLGAPLILVYKKRENTSTIKRLKD